MKAEIVAVGTELLLGDIVNGNAAWLGRELAEIGVDVELTTAVGDNIGRIADGFGSPANVPTSCCVTGGLGPTQDDLTREALAELAGVRLFAMPQLEAALLARYAAAGRTDFPPNNLRMADRPEGASALPNSGRHGARSAHADRVERRRRVRAAGRAGEMHEIFGDWIRAELAERAGPGQIAVVAAAAHRRHVGVAGFASPRRNRRRLGDCGNPTIAYLASQGQTLVRMTAKAPTAGSRARADRRCRDAGARSAGRRDLRRGRRDARVGRARAVADRGATVATAESLTGGLLGAALSSTPGASATYRGGAVLYATDTKAAVVDVPAALLEERGPVDPDVAVAMADGVRRGSARPTAWPRRASQGRRNRTASRSARSTSRSSGRVMLRVVGELGWPVVATGCGRGVS